MATSDGCSVTLEDVLFGDVWVCSGQSNMEQPISEVISYITQNIDLKY